VLTVYAIVTDSYLHTIMMAGIVAAHESTTSALLEKNNEVVLSTEFGIEPGAGLLSSFTPQEPLCC
jgi:hypothetical protein